MNQEIWKPIKGYENYIVSSKGRIAKILKGDSNGKGYRFIKFKDGKRIYIHRLVAENHIDNPNNEPIINHINGDKSDNRIENLEWCNYSYNEKEAYRLGLKDRKGTKINQYDLEGNFVKEWESMSEVERQLGYDYTGISSCCRNKMNTCHGYIWKYKNNFKGD